MRIRHSPHDCIYEVRQQGIVTVRIHFVLGGRLEIFATQNRIDDSLGDGNIERRVFGQLQEVTELSQVGFNKESAVTNRQVTQASGSLFAGLGFGVRGFEQAENGCGDGCLGVCGGCGICDGEMFIRSKMCTANGLSFGFTIDFHGLVFR